VALGARGAECRSASAVATTEVRSTAATRAVSSRGPASSNAHANVTARAPKAVSITAITKPRTALVGWRW